VNFIIAKPLDEKNPAHTAHYTNAPYLRIAPNGVYVKTKIADDDEMATYEEYVCGSNGIVGFLLPEGKHLQINGNTFPCICVTIRTTADTTFFNGSLFCITALGENARLVVEEQEVVLMDADKDSATF